ncbi:MAG: AAA family ATPase [Patescibacteria group bacterium]|nr:AAA family ATPase [Patescibacteria group bacterium]
MYLEKLEIQGFKSFANKNKLVFSNKIDANGHRGLTAVVGPNGSGKSNIADAIRWVLGEQSLKTLRGKKSEDVIFSGSDQKSQLSMAEVSLYLNNEDHQIVPVKNDEGEKETDASGHSLSPLDYDEIVITRRLFRNGDSEYLLNNNRVRLADIQILLAKANVGQKTYSVIGQGMVENFLNTGAAERKDFFDEATGVKQFQIKRDAALNKLESSYDNLVQVEMLLNEIKPRLKMLTRQVERLKKRGQLETELNTRQHRYYFQLWQDIDSKFNQAKNGVALMEKEKQEKEAGLEKIKTELNAIKSKDDSSAISQLQERLKKYQRERSDITQSIARLNAELELQLESQGQFDVAWLNGKQGELKEEQRRLNQEIISLENEDVSGKEAALRAQIQKLGEELNRRENFKREYERQQEEKSQLLKNLARLDAVLEANLEAQGQFDVAWLNNKQEELKRALDNLKKEIESININDSKDAVTELENKKTNLDNLINRDNQELQAINNFLKNSSKPAAGRAEINESIDEFLKKLDAIKGEQNLEKIKTLIEEAKQTFQKQIRSLIDGENAAKLEQAKTLQENIIKNSEARQILIAEINELRLELSTKQERRRLLENSWEASTREIRDIEEKIAKSQIKFDSAQIEKEKDQINQALKSLEISIQENLKRSQTGDIVTERYKLSNELNECRLNIFSRQQKLDLYLEKRRQTEKEIKDIEEKIAKSQIKFDSAQIEKEKSALNGQLADLDAKIDADQAELQKYNAAKEEETNKLFAYQSQSQNLQTEINQLSGRLNNLQIELARQETRLEDLENNIADDGLELNSIKQYKAADEDNLADERLRQRIQELKGQLEMIGGIDPETEKEFQETDERYRFLDQQTQDLNTAIESLEKVIAELDINIKEKFEQEFRIISEKFSEYFKILFNGGTAKIFKLEAMEEDKEAPEKQSNSATDERSRRLKNLRKHNALGLAGIEIQATPPGKKIQTISMLSGGERALTAIALICAIISANPSPFVVLDEVDAALDEANSERLAQILDDLSSKTQFVTITHNRASMKRASIIYGVTMKADGVSQLLSIRLDDINAFRN